MGIYVLILILSVCALVIGTITARHFEKKEFNEGCCTECNSKLRRFDQTDLGNRGYVCDQCGNRVWVSYNVDKDFE